PEIGTGNSTNNHPISIRPTFVLPFATVSKIINQITIYARKFEAENKSQMRENLLAEEASKRLHLSRQAS
ncbi:unnamed protein product, partial [Ceratitis capitata]